MGGTDDAIHEEKPTADRAEQERDEVEEPEDPEHPAAGDPDYATAEAEVADVVEQQDEVPLDDDPPQE